MSLTTLLTQTATVVSWPQTGLDEYGNLAPGPETRVDYPARLEQVGTDEVLHDRDTVTSDWRLFLPPTADISEYDRVEVDDTTFEVVGRPAVERTPQGAHHILARLRHIV